MSDFVSWCRHLLVPFPLHFIEMIFPLVIILFGFCFFSTSLSTYATILVFRASNTCTKSQYKGTLTSLFMHTKNYSDSQLISFTSKSNHLAEIMQLNTSITLQYKEGKFGLANHTNEKLSMAVVGCS